MAYADDLVSVYGATEVWALTDIASGTTIHATANGNRDGTLVGWDLQNTTGPTGADSAPYSDGANDYGNIYTSNGTDGLVDIWDGGEFSLFIWLKYGGTWGPAVAGGAIRIRADASNLIEMAVSGGALDIDYIAGGTATTVVYPSASHGDPTGWFSWGVSVSSSADEMKAFFGLAGGSMSQIGTTQTGLGTWSGSPASTTSVIGARNTSANTPWEGWLAYAALKAGGIWTPTQFGNMHAAVTSGGGIALPVVMHHRRTQGMS